MIACAPLAIAAAIVYNIYLCNSRGAMLALGTMTFLWAVRRFGFRRSIIVLPMLLIPMILLAPNRLSQIATRKRRGGRVIAAA